VKIGKVLAREQRTARLTILIDPRKKAVFESLCAADDVTPSQVVRSLIRRYIEERQGEPWRPDAVSDEHASAGAPPKGTAVKRRRVAP
jgi:Ribbon-helix-helix protein